MSLILNLVNVRNRFMYTLSGIKTGGDIGIATEKREVFAVLKAEQRKKLPKRQKMKQFFKVQVLLLIIVLAAPMVSGSGEH